MKVCRKCGFEKENEYFNKNKNNKDGLQNYCKVCKTQIDKRNTLRNIKSIKENNKRKIHQKSQIRDKWKKFLGGICRKCQEDKLYLLDFHHLDEKNKIIDISTLIGHVGNNNPIIKKEVKKCILLCANHHREFHYLEKLNGIKIKEYIAG